MLAVFDLDGTLSDDGHRQHFLHQSPRDWDGYFGACDADKPIEPVVSVMRGLWGLGHIHVSHPQQWDIEIWTGRPEAYREQTVAWLKRYGLRWDRLRMRADGDLRPAWTCKSEWLVDGKPDLMFDDQAAAVGYWRSIGIVCLQVADHDYSEAPWKMAHQVPVWGFPTTEGWRTMPPLHDMNVYTEQDYGMDAVTRFEPPCGHWYFRMGHGLESDSRCIQCTTGPSWKIAPIYQEEGGR